MSAPPWAYALLFAGSSVSTSLVAQNPAPVLTPSAPTRAQAVAHAQTGVPVSNAQITDAIRASGLSEDQVRARLRGAGFEAGLVDPFFSQGKDKTVTESTLEAAAANQDNLAVATALEQIGIMPRQPAGDVARSARLATGSQFFGKDVFVRQSTRFMPVSNGPVDPSYRVGVGDRLQLVLTGDIERAYPLEIRRDGTVLVPDLGQVSIAGLTLDGARATLRARAATSYSGLNNGHTQLDLSVVGLRSNLVYVLGEVESPGAYQVSSLATAFHAIAQADGPSARGSYRDVVVRRAGQIVKHIDLYDYLLEGDSKNDIRTEQGDIIYVPLSTRQVTVKGAVRRPSVFELRSTEGFSDLVRLAGGFLATASLARVQIDRVLPPAQRRPGRDRVIIDVPLNDEIQNLEDVKLEDNDVVTVFGVGDTRRNQVVVKGEVVSPGVYEWKPGMTLGDVIGRVNGFLPWSLTDRIKLVRLTSANGGRVITSLDASDAAARRTPIEEFDEIEVLDARAAAVSGTVTVSGAVNKASDLPFASNLTLKDAIDLSGGFKEDAQVIEIARRRTGASYSDTTSVVTKLPVDRSPQGEDLRAHLLLERGDMIAVRGSPGFRASRSVTVSGLFAYPGPYAIVSDSERVRDLIRRAGGPLPAAYAPTFRLVRQGMPVSIDLDRALAGDREHNIAIENGDQIEIGSYPAVVTIGGAVERPAAVPYRDGWSLEQYVDAAGGRLATAEKRDAVVEYPSGRVAHATSHLWVIHSTPDIQPGAKITVIAAPQGGTNTAMQALNTTAQMATGVLSVIVSFLALKRL